MVMKMDEGLDTGAIAMAERVPIGADATTGELHDELARRGADLMLRALGRARKRPAATDAASGERRHLRQQDRQERDAHRLDQAVERSPRPLPRAVAVSRRLVRACRRRTRQDFAHDQRRRQRAAGPRARRQVDDRLRQRRRAARANCSAPASSRWQRTNSCAGRPSRPQPCCIDMPRYKLTIEYDGTPYVGWQMQDNGPTIQGALTEAIAAFTGARPVVYGAGRTDAGVHALGQVAHVDLARDWDSDNVRDAINFHLRPRPIAVLTAERVAETFDARFSATRRHYLYRISNRRADLALEQNRAWRVPRPLDCAAMHSRRAKTDRQARFHHLPFHRVPGEIAGENARPARRRARRRRRARHRVGALVPATPGALDGRLAGPCRRRQMER